MTAAHVAPLIELLLAFETGKRPKGGAVKVGVPSLGGEHVTATGELKLAPMKFVPEHFYAGMLKGHLSIGDILVVKDGATTGRVGMVEDNFPFERAGVNEHLFLLRANQNVVGSKYLFFYLRSHRGQAEIMSDFRGAAQGGISREIGSKVRVPLRPFEEQDRIVDLLSRAEGIVRLRREAQHKTAELVPALFLEMFGDPSSNPKGWPVVELGELIVDGPQNGLYKHKSLYGDGTPILRIDGFYGGSVNDLASLQRVRLAPEEIERYGLTSGEIVINRVNSPDYLGKSALIPDLHEPTVFESNMMRLRLDTTRITQSFAIASLQTDAVRKQILASAKHAINQSSINQQDVKALRFSLPPIELQRQFAAKADAVRGIAAQQTAALATAQATFDALLHQFFQN